MERPELERVQLLLGKDQVSYLSQCRVLVAGIGGVGSYAIEALARTGIGTIVMVDKDVVDITNLNRQIMATYSTVGKEKGEAMKERILSYNSQCEVVYIQSFVNQELLNQLPEVDFVIDAIDTVSAKLDLIDFYHNKQIPFISSLGMGNRLDPSKVEVRELFQTEGDPLARSIRSQTRKRGMDYQIPVVFSTEQPMVQREVIHPDGKTRKEQIPPSSAMFVPATAGLLCASYCIRKLLEQYESH